MLNDPGWVYTIHLLKPIGREGRNGAQHYTGWSARDELAARLLEHRRGRGARILAYCHEQGIGWVVGALQRGTPADERRLKRRWAAERCWCCTRTPVEPRPRPNRPRRAPSAGGTWVLQGPLWVQTPGLSDNGTPLGLELSELPF